MKVTTYEATVENGQIKLGDSVRLPEQAKVYIVVPEVEEPTRFQVGSPRLARPADAADFVKEVQFVGNAHPIYFDSRRVGTAHQSI